MPNFSTDSALALAQKIRRRIVLPEKLHRLVSQHEPAFECPLCQYNGPFRTYRPGTGKRLHAQCPRCKSLERHRSQRVVLENILSEATLGDLRVLHFAPEKFQRLYLQSLPLASYVTADLEWDDVDYNVDMCDLPFDDGSFDLIYASHVLEHIQDDHKALSEVSRVLSPNGIALLPVPVVQQHTVEYDKPNPLEEFHVRAIGEDYFDRYSQYFTSVEIVTSSSLPETIQSYVYEDRTTVPNARYPHRSPVVGYRHEDFVPICRR